MTRIFGLILAIVAMAAASSAQQCDTPNRGPLQPPDDVMTIKLFGMHIHHPTASTLGRAPAFGTWRLWDAHVAWPNLEPEREKWNFATLDSYVDLAEKRGIEILLPLGLSPRWASARQDEPSGYAPGYAAEPKNLDDWRDYVRTVATRYKGRIHCYEIWNEPNLKDFFSGSPQQMFELARAAHGVLKEVDPQITVVSPSSAADYGVKWLDDFLQKGAGAFVDVIGYHFYVTPQAPETMVGLVSRVREAVEKYHLGNKPLWDTESGWLIESHRAPVKPGTGSWSKVLSEDEASAYVARAYVLLWAAGVSRFYWYDWDGDKMGLAEEDGVTLKPAARAYAEAERWLVGARMVSCGQDAQATWTAHITRRGSYRAWLVWNPARAIEFEVPGKWRVRDVR